MIGVDVGGTRIKLAVVEGETSRRAETVDTPHGTLPSVVLDRIASAALLLEPRPQEMGVAIPGEVDARGNCIRLPNIPGFEGVPIQAELEKRTGARVSVDNDANAAGLGELLFGHSSSHDNFLLLTLGTGVGGGLVLGRRVIRGAHGFAAEVGHMTLDPNPGQPPCGCGNTGCLESYAGTAALLRVFRAHGGADTHEVHDVAESARRGEPSGLAAFSGMAEALGIALNSIQNLLDLDAFVFSGGVARSFDLIEPGIRRTLRKRAFAKVLGEVPLLRSDLGDTAGVIGPAHLPRHVG